MTAFLVSAAVLGLVIGGGIFAITRIRGRMRGGDDQVAWERTLADYRNLRDEGVLSEEEYRKISTLVEPHVRLDVDKEPGRNPRARAS